MTDRKKPGVAFWAAVVASILVLYVLSVGPACWISSRADCGASAVSTVYRPLIWIVYQSERAEEALCWYSRVGAVTDWQWIRGTWIESNGLIRLSYPKYRAINHNLGID